VKENHAGQRSPLETASPAWVRVVYHNTIMHGMIHDDGVVCGVFGFSWKRRQQKVKKTQEEGEEPHSTHPGYDHPVVLGETRAPVTNVPSKGGRIRYVCMHVVDNLEAKNQASGARETDRRKGLMKGRWGVKKKEAPKAC
jgi:hypothetical protein